MRVLEAEMKLRIGRGEFAEAVTWVARALPSRPVVPILAGLLLEAGEGQLTLSCFDYEVSARVRTQAAVSEPGTVVVSGRLLAEIARSLPAKPVDLTSDGTNVLVTCGSTRFSLIGLPSEDFPALPSLPSPAGTVDGAQFATAVGQVAVAAGRDDTLPMLTGVLVEIDDAVMTLVATDRYRMGVRELGWRPARPGIRAKVLVPARALSEAAKTMNGRSDVAISLAGQTGPGPQSPSGPGLEYGAAGPAAGAGAADGTGTADGLIGFACDDRRLTTRLLGTEFVTYKSRFPREHRARARLAAGPFSEAIRRVALVADRDSRLLLTFGADGVVLETGSNDGSRAVEKAPAGFEGEEGFAIGFKPQYLLDGIGAASTGAQPRPAAEPRDDRHDSGGADSGEGAHTGGDGPPGGHVQTRETGQHPGRQCEVTLQFTTPDKPAVVTGVPGFRYLLAPMRS